MNRGRNCAPLEVRNHLSEEVSSNQADLVRALRGRQRATNRKTVDGIYVDSGKFRFVPEQSCSLAKTLVRMFVAFDHRDNLSAWASLPEARDESVGLLTVIDGLQHSSNDRHLGLRAED